MTPRSVGGRESTACSGLSSTAAAAPSSPYSVSKVRTPSSLTTARAGRLRLDGRAVDALKHAANAAEQCDHARRRVHPCGPAFRRARRACARALCAARRVSFRDRPGARPSSMVLLVRETVGRGGRAKDGAAGEATAACSRHPACRQDRPRRWPQSIRPRPDMIALIASL